MLGRQISEGSAVQAGEAAVLDQQALREGYNILARAADPQQDGQKLGIG